MGNRILKKVATSQCEFEKLRKHDDYVYVDKTDMLAKLAMRENDAFYFIARPRRFGKSLMLSTLKCMFEGKRELFHDLKIERLGWDWTKTYPVINLNMQDFKAPTPDALESALLGEIHSIAARYRLRIDWDKYRTSGQAFTECLKLLGKKGDFVVLVDEYDVPLQGFLGRSELETVRGILHDFYSAFKSNMGTIRFLMMAGVSKFTKLSVFSSLNSLKDLTIEDGESAALLGYTHEELRKYFGDHIAQLGERLGQSPQKTFQDILDWYDSYRFTPYSELSVINPVALGQAINLEHFGSYWSDTGMPTLILERLQAGAKRPDQLHDVEARIGDLDVCDAIEMPWLPLLYQAGYLTIKDVQWVKMEHGGDVLLPLMRLGIPNTEVRVTLNGQWWNTLMQLKESEFTALVHEAEHQIAQNDIEGMLGTLYALYAKLPPTWSPQNEADAKRYFLLFMEMAGARMRPEKPTCRGFADAVLETSKGVWVMEFKFNRSAASAIRQIRQRGYGDAYRQDSRPITLVGIKFDPKRKNIDIPKFETL